MPFSPKKEHWTSQDLIEGHCTLDQVGMPIATAPTVEIEGPNSDWTKAAFHSMGGKAGFIAYCKANPAQMWPQLVKLNLPQLLKESEPTTKLEDIPLEALDNMSSVEVKRLLLASQGITTKSQLEELRAKG
jgi:hypothetical protein